MSFIPAMAKLSFQQPLFFSVITFAAQETCFGLLIGLWKLAF